MGTGRMWLVYILVVWDIRKDNFMVFKIKLPAEFRSAYMIRWRDGLVGRHDNKYEGRGEMRRGPSITPSCDSSFRLSVQCSTADI